MFEVYVFGGSIGEVASHTGKSMHLSGVGTGRLYGTYNTREEAKRAGKSYIKSFGGGRRNYYHPKYRIVEGE
jgi:hypothetical protein